jgi:hypothetical protein
LFVQAPVEQKSFMIRQSFAAIIFPILAIWLFLAPGSAYPQATQSTNPQQWDKTLEAAKKEGRVRVSIPASGKGARAGVESRADFIAIKAR